MADDRQIGACGGVGFGGYWWIWIIAFIILLCFCGGFGFVAAP